MLGNDRGWKWILPGLACLTFYVYHVHYLAFVHFDYGYNMVVNVTVGEAKFLDIVKRLWGVPLFSLRVVSSITYAQCTVIIGVIKGGLCFPWG